MWEAEGEQYLRNNLVVNLRSLSHMEKNMCNKFDVLNLLDNFTHLFWPCLDLEMQVRHGTHIKCLHLNY